MIAARDMSDRLDLTPDNPRKMLLAASTGGHIAQLVRLAPGLGATDDSLWVSFDSPQTRSLLRDKRTLLVPYIKPRDWRGTLKAVGQIDKALSVEDFDAAVSTGAALAAAALPVARRRGIPALYIESVSRVLGPSLAGRMLYHSRLAEMRTQHRSWAGGRWGLHPSVLETFSIEDRPAPEGRPLKIFVTLGTIQGYRFDTLVDALLATGLMGEDTTWQLGYTTRDDLPGRVVQDMDAASFDRALHEADVVVTHAGVGTILGLLEAGVYPVAVVRRASRNEHVDDHQAQIAGLMNDTRIGTAVEIEDVTAQVLLEAAARRIATTDGQPAPEHR